jgi:predicted permease
MANDILMPFVGGIQATISVLLTIVYGVAFSQFGLLDADAASKISRTSVKVLLPALLIYNLGSTLEIGTARNYVPILSMLHPRHPYNTPALTSND